jgi:hypothetical protein
MQHGDTDNYAIAVVGDGEHDALPERGMGRTPTKALLNALMSPSFSARPGVNEPRTR